MSRLKVLFRRLLPVCTAALFISASGVVGADGSQPDTSMASLVGTLGVNAQPIFSGGKLTGCTLVYDVLTQDYVYGAGQYMRISGSFGLMTAAESTLGGVVKVVANKVGFYADGNVSLTPAAPDWAYLVGDGLTNNYADLVASYHSDTPGAIFAIYPMESVMPYFTQFLETGYARVGFNRTGGNSDIQMDIDLTIASISGNGIRQQSPTMVQEFASCLLALLEAT